LSAAIEIDGDEAGVDLIGLEGSGRLLTKLSLSSSDEDGEACLAELAGGFVADAFVGSGDESDLFGSSGHLCSPVVY
jgi:hypothetical protein